MCQFFFLSRDHPDSATDQFAPRQGDFAFVLQDGQHPGLMVVGQTWHSGRQEFIRAPSSTRWNAKPALAGDGLPDFFCLDVPGTIAEVYAQLDVLLGKRTRPLERKVDPVRTNRLGGALVIGRSGLRLSRTKLASGDLDKLLADGRLATDVVTFATLIEERVTERLATDVATFATLIEERVTD